MPFYRYVEFVIYSVLNLMPYMLLALYPVRDRLRISKRAAVFCLVFLCALDSVRTYMIAVGFSSAILSPLTFMVQAAFYIIAADQRIGKSIFNLLVLSNLASCIGFAAKCTEAHIFPVLAMQKDRWSCSLCIILIQILVLTPIFRYVRDYFDPIMRKSQADYLFRYLWIVPAVFYVMWYNYTFLKEVPMIKTITDPIDAVIQSTIVAGSFVIYHTAMLLVDISTQNTESKEKEREYLVQQRFVQERIEATRRARHDIRHHLNIITAYARDGKQTELLEYLGQCRDSVLYDSYEMYCDNYIVNTLLSYYAARARDMDVDTDIRVSMPRDIAIKDEDLVVLLGNLLENAVEACGREQGRAELTASINKSGKSLYIRISNTCTAVPVKSPEGGYRTSKSNASSHGIGLGSIKSAVESYGGLLDVRHEDDRFAVHIMMPCA